MRTRRPDGRPGTQALTAGGPSLAAVVVLALTAACSNTVPTASTVVGDTTASTEATATPASSAAPATSAAPTATPDTIPQPVMIDALPVAPEAERIDLVMPTFSDPTGVTNPLHPSALVESVLLLGTVDDEVFRTEVTLLPEVRIIEWNDQRIEALVSQYVAFLDGRIHEVAYDFYAQADDGSVWYLGEDVYNFADGAIVDTHGTWIAGKDGPGAMIMPADPRVGDTYRPENIPGFVFEEVTVASVDQPADGPFGPIDGGLVITELHMDGSLEDKTFAPGYGEFYTSGGGDTEALALAVPIDAAPGTAPADLEVVWGGALAVVDALADGAWQPDSFDVDEMVAAWERLAAAGAVPVLVEPVTSRALADLTAAVEASDAAAAGRAAMTVAQTTNDLRLRYGPVAEVDLARVDLWLTQLAIDADAGDSDAVNGDFFTIDYLRDRILHTLDGTARTLVNTGLEELQGAVSDGDLPAAADAAMSLRATVRSL